MILDHEPMYQHEDKDKKQQCSLLTAPPQLSNLQFPSLVSHHKPHVWKLQYSTVLRAIAAHMPPAPSTHHIHKQVPDHHVYTMKTKSIIRDHGSWSSNFPTIPSLLALHTV